MDIRLTLAVEAYSEISGYSVRDILEAMSADAECQIARNVIMLMFAAG